MRRLPYMSARKGAERVALRLGRPVTVHAVLRALARGELQARPLTDVDGSADSDAVVICVRSLDAWAGPRGRGERGAGISRKG